jgi:hypothetical protein
MVYLVDCEIYRETKDNWRVLLQINISFIDKYSVSLANGVDTSFALKSMKIKLNF